MKKIIEFIKKWFTHNRCDTCGFTKYKVYLIELYSEAGLIQCEKCYKCFKEHLKSENDENKCD